MVDDGFLRAKAAALAGFGETGADHLNCAQAVVRFAAILLDARQDSAVLARCFGGGMTGMGRVCGALSGAALSVGPRDLSLGPSRPAWERASGRGHEARCSADPVFVLAGARTRVRAQRAFRNTELRRGYSWASGARGAWIERQQRRFA